MTPGAPYPVIVAFGAVLSMIVLSIVGLAFLFVLGTVVYGIALAVVPEVASLCSDARDRLLRRNGDDQRRGAAAQQQTSSLPGTAERMDVLDASTEDLWRRMQGTSKKDRRRRIGS
jgi:hypothetical protein